MKAILCTRYGSPEVLQLQDVPTPEPKDNEVLIKIHTATVGPSDCAFRKANPFIIRLMYGLRKPKNPMQGTEFSGEIESIGKDVTSFRKGDEVFGMSPHKFGAHAEYLSLGEAEVIGAKSPKMTHAEAVGICDGGLTALIFIRDKAKVKPGQKVLVNGASGAVGAYAVQLAKAYGAEVTGVCSGANVALVKSLGADKVIDYTREDFTKARDTYDVIFDAIGKSSFSRCKSALKQDGIYLSTVPSLGIMFHMLRTSRFGRKKAIFTPAGLQQNKANLDYLNKRFDEGQIKAVIDRRYPLAQTAEAHRYVDTGRKKGNVIITVTADA